MSRIPSSILICLLALACVPLAPACAADYVSALLMEAETGQLLVSDSIEREWIPASVVKLMVLLLAEEAIADGRASLDDEVIATARAQKQGGSQVYLGRGEKTTLGKLIEAAAVGSANDAIVAAAVALYGSVDEAVLAMNARAAELGMASTSYVNVTGLPERRGPENRTCALDQARLAREIVLKHPGVLEWTGKIWTRFRKGLVLGCTNTLLKEYEGLDGLKTGYHHKARSNLVATAERDGRRLIAVILGSPSQGVRNRVARRLLNEGFEDWVRVDTFAGGEAFPGEFPVDQSWNAKVTLKAGADLSYLVRPRDRGRVRIAISDDTSLVAPLSEGQCMGEIQVLLDGRVLASVPALAGSGVPRAWFKLPFAGGEMPSKVLDAGMLELLPRPVGTQ